MSPSDTNVVEPTNAVDPAAATTTVDPAATINKDFPHPITFNVEEKFSFRAPKDAEGKPLLDDLGEKVPKRDAITLTLPTPTLEGVLTSLDDDKQRQYILDILKEQVVAAAREQLNSINADGEWIVNKQEDLDLSKLTLAFLANVPKAERRGGGIPKEVWEDFSKDYVAIMPGITSKPVEKVAKAAQLFVARLQPVKTFKPMLKVLKEQLQIWASNSTQLSELEEVYTFLNTKLDTFLNAKDEDLISSI